MDWATFEQMTADCRACPLCEGIAHKVPGQGCRDAAVMFIGEGPGQTEDEEGLAFVGAAGQLLTELLDSVGLKRDRIYICNIVKCRPPGNRVPSAGEAAACRPLLDAQIALVQPRIIVLLGSTALREVLGPDFRITRDRGKWYMREGIYYMATFHPSYLLRSPERRTDTQSDLQSLLDRMAELGLPTPT